MSVEWDEIVADAAAAIEEVGFAATLLRPGVKSGPESNPTIGAPVQVPVTIIKISLDRLRRAGTLVEGTKAAYLLAAEGLSPEPSTKDKLSVDGMTKTVLEVSEVSPGNVDILYTLQVAG